ncbi:MAG: YciI family protein [Thiomicrospira sp.]|jgi:uncharacterized protein YciI|nr:YciI family protein [Thiomicrospira sp.]
MLFAIIAHDIEDSLTLRQKTRPAHLARLEQLQQQGRLLLAGPTPNVAPDSNGEQGFSGSLIVAEFDSLEQANAWAEADPYMQAGVYEYVDVKPFKQVFPRPQE